MLKHLWSATLSFTRPRLSILYGQTHPRDNIIHYRQIEKQFRLIVNKWFGLIDKTGASLRLMSQSFYHKGVFDQYDFLPIVQSLESYHRSNCKMNLISPPSKHKYYVKKVLESLPSGLEKQFDDSIRAKITYSNEAGLRKRFKSLVDSLGIAESKKILGKKPKDILSNVVDTRNYLLIMMKLRPGTSME
jgi:hypothetical protein